MGKLTNITGIEYLNTSEVTNMAFMFNQCSSLTSLDLSNFNTAKVTDMSYMFYNCKALMTIYAGDGWNTDNVITSSSEMFTYCTSLVGGSGTRYDVNHIDKEYARIDGGTSNPGYFSKYPEAYAVRSGDTLTFYYDTNRSLRTGMTFDTTYDLNTETTYPEWYIDCKSFNSVVFAPSFAAARPKSTRGWFYEMSNLTDITGIENLNTSEVTTMYQMFGDCSGLTTLDLRGFNTAKVTDMSSMFYNCSCLTTIYAGDGWNTENVTSSDNMFTYCTSLVGGNGTRYDASHIGKEYARIDGGTSNPGYFSKYPEAYAELSGDTLTFYYDGNRSSRTDTTFDLNTGDNPPGWYDNRASIYAVAFVPSFAAARPTTTFQWFFGMTNLTSITGIEYLNASEVTNMTQMFGDCSGLTTLDLSHFNTEKVTTMGYMFGNCSSLTTIYAGDGWNTDNVTSSDDMFSNCSTNLVGSRGTTWNSSNPTDKTYARIDGGTSNPGYFSKYPEAYAVLDGTTLAFYYDVYKGLRTGTTYDLNTGNNIPEWESNSSYINSVVFDPSFAAVRPTSTYRWFYGMSNLINITGIKYLNTSEVTTMNGMFYGCSGMTSLDLSNFNTANVTDMTSMFYGCSGMTTLDLSNFNTANVTYMRWMFCDCSVMTSLDVTHFNTANVTDMSYMFNYCSALTSLDVSNFNTENVTDMSYMFSRCSSLTSLDVTSFNTANVTNMSEMFRGCNKLTSLDLSNFNTANVTSMGYMFGNCSSLATIYAGDGWNTGNVTSSDDMFRSCTNLVGGNGTTYDASHIDKEYARIDGGTSNPGYFSHSPEAYAVLSDEWTLTFYYDANKERRPGTTYNLNTGSNNPVWYENSTAITAVVFDRSFAAARPTSTYQWFYGLINLTSITDIEYLNTSEVTTMYQMFSYCFKLTSLDVSNFNTEKVTNMYQMFFNCSRMTSLDVSSFNTEKVTTMNGMFSGCNKLTSLDLSHFNTEKVSDMSYMFQDCSALTTIYVGNGWNTYEVTSSDDMFRSCTNLVGGSGTTYDASHIDKEYARIDGGPSSSTPGYFSVNTDYLKGDVNEDGSVTIADVTALVNIILGKDIAPVSGVADVNEDSSVTIADVTALVNIILGK